MITQILPRLIEFFYISIWQLPFYYCKELWIFYVENTFSISRTFSISNFLWYSIAKFEIGIEHLQYFDFCLKIINVLSHLYTIPFCLSNHISRLKRNNLPSVSTVFFVVFFFSIWQLIKEL